MLVNCQNKMGTLGLYPKNKIACLLSRQNKIGTLGCVRKKKSKKQMTAARFELAPLYSDEKTPVEQRRYIAVS